MIPLFLPDLKTLRNLISSDDNHSTSYKWSPPFVLLFNFFTPLPPQTGYHDRLFRSVFSSTATTAMANHLISSVAAILAVACVLPALTLAARDMSAYKKSFVVQGHVFCDTCRAGFETPMSTYIKGAKVRVECRSKATGAKICSFEGTTDHTGTYNIVVADEHEHETCETVAISSSEPGCQTLLESRKSAPVFLSHNNGIASDTRYANAVGFVKDSALSACTELLATYKQYELEDEN